MLVFFRSRFSIFGAGLLLIVVIAGALRLASYRFSLPYIDHVDEPAYYLGGQEWRGLYDSGGYYDGIPPAYVALNAGLQPVLEAVGIRGLSSTIEFLRLVAVITNLVTLIFIALTARLAGGDLAGVTAGIAWAIAPLVLENGVYALPDPLIYCLTALALWLASAALLQPHHKHWSVWSVVAGLLAVLMKYPALPALLPGIVVALIWLVREKRGWRLLLIQFILIAVIGLWLVFIYGVDFNNLQREGAVVQSQGMSNIFNLSRAVHNISMVFEPIRSSAFWIVAAAGLVAYGVALRQKTPRIHMGIAGLGILLIVTIPWLTGAFSSVGIGTIRYVLPGTTAACVILGVAVEQIKMVVSHIRVFRQTLSPRLISGALMLPMIAFIWLPQWNTDQQIVRNRQFPDSRVMLREWFDISLDPGTVIVSADNHKTFNPIWGGIPYRHWVDWWITSDIMEHPLKEWIEQRGMTYAALTKADLDNLESHAGGQDYLAQMLPLRDFFAPGLRGPQMAFYRLWRMQVETDIHFGDSIRLTGYDLNSTTSKPGDTLTFRFYWQANTVPADNYSVFIHFTSLDDFTPLTQADGAPAVKERPTLSWNDPGETLISQPFNLVLPADLPGGDYRIRVGLYNYVSGQRLPVLDAEGAALGDTDNLLIVHISG